MPGYDVMGLLREYDGKQKSGGTSSDGASSGGSDGRAEAEKLLSRAEEIASNEVGDTSRERQIRNAVEDGTPEDQMELLERAAGRRPDMDGPKIDAPEYQRRAVAMMLNSTNLKNAQAVVAISNRENIRKGLGRDPGLQKQKAAARGQFSTVAISTSLLRYVQQEIGPLSKKTSQNDAMNGFLYWYFGKPDGIVFATPDSAERVEEVVSNLDLNASPAKFNRVNYNMSSSLLERLDEIRDRLDAVASWMQADMKDGVKSRMQADKVYIALCYLILSQSALAPPLRPDQEAGDIDLLAEGGVWDLMGGIDAAYDFYSAKNGREIYKAKHGVRPGGFRYTAGNGAAASGEGGGSLYGGDSGGRAPGSPSDDDETRRRAIPVSEPEYDGDDGEDEDYEGEDEGYDGIDMDELEGFDMYAGMYGDTTELQRPDDDVQASDRSATDLLSSLKKDAASKRNLEEFKKKLPKRQDTDPGWSED